MHYFGPLFQAVGVIVGEGIAVTARWKRSLDKGNNRSILPIAASQADYLPYIPFSQFSLGEFKFCASNFFINCFNNFLIHSPAVKRYAQIWVRVIHMKWGSGTNKSAQELTRRERKQTDPHPGD